MGSTVLLSLRLLLAAGEFTDDFTGTSPGPQWSASANAGTAVSQNDWVTVSRSSGTTGNLWAAYQTSTPLDVRNHQLWVEVADAGDQTLPGWSMNLCAKIDTDNQVEFAVRGNQLIADSWVGGSFNVLANVAWTAQMRWLRIREVTGTTYWDTSADGVHWNNLVSTSNVIPEDALVLVITGGGIGTFTASTSGNFDNFGYATLAAPSRVGIVTPQRQWVAGTCPGTAGTVRSNVLFYAVVAVVDGHGNYVPDAAPVVTLSLLAGPDPTAPFEASQTIALQGQASFAVSVNRPGRSYQLLATAPGFTSALSPSFDVGPLSYDVGFSCTAAPHWGPEELIILTVLGLVLTRNLGRSRESSGRS